MPKNKKKFISKENALVFQLVHRSQQDPLAVDENAPQHVLKEKTKARKMEERKYGIFFDDEYNYLQHLKTLTQSSTTWEQINYETGQKKNLKSTKAKIFLPSSVFESEIEEQVGILNKAAPVYGPRPEFDPDIVAAMDDDFDYDNPDNLLEENFVELANKSDFNLNKENYYNLKDSLDELSSESNLSDNKSKFTNYSMTSSVIRRNEQLMLLDNQFEKVFENYESNEIGCLIHESIEGFFSLDKSSSQCLKIQLDELLGGKIEEKNNDLILKKKTLMAAESQFSHKEETEFLDINEKNTEKWDCETIISTYSNIYNHPAKISEPKIVRIEVSQKTGLPIDFSTPRRLTAKSLAIFDKGNTFLPPTKSIISQLSELSIRPKHETSEERKSRKKIVKELRRERRIEKKANALAFKKEKSKQEKILVNSKSYQPKIKMI